MPKKTKYRFDVPVLPRVPRTTLDKLEWKKSQLVVWLMQRELDLHGDL